MARDCGQIRRRWICTEIDFERQWITIRIIAFPTQGCGTPSYTCFSIRWVGIARHVGWVVLRRIVVIGLRSHTRKSYEDYDETAQQQSPTFFHHQHLPHKFSLKQYNTILQVHCFAYSRFRFIKAKPFFRNDRRKGIDEKFQHELSYQKSSHCKSKEVLAWSVLRC